jgi:branched-chain amino acid transport system substrate-binding protein
VTRATGFSVKRFTALVAVLALGGFAACGGDDEGGSGSKTGGGGDPIKIGAVLGSSGAIAQSGTEMLNGMKLAVEKLNAEGGIEGHKVELVHVDDQNDPQQAVTATRKVLSQGIKGLVGSSSSTDGVPIAEVAKNTVPTVLALAASVEIGPKGYTNVAQMNNPAAQKEKVVVDYLTNNPDVKRVAMILQNNEFGKGYLAQYQEAFKSAGNGQEIVYSGFFQGDQTDFSALVAKAKAANPDALYIAGFAEQWVKVLNQAKDVGLTPKVVWLSPENISPATLKLDAKALEGVVSANSFNPYEVAGKPEAEEFAKSYESKYGILPGFFSATAYDSVMYLAAAMKAAGTVDDAKKIAAQFGKVDYTGPRGKLTLDENRQVSLEPELVTVKGGQLAAVAH